jgi:addiction module HigA family antidote
MKIRNVLHRGLRRFIQHNDASGLAPAVVERVRNILTFLQEMEDAGELQAAKALGVTRAALSALLNGRAALSPDMALRIEKAFGPKMDTLLRMQTAYEIAETRDREADIKVKRYVAKVSTARDRATL